MPQVNVFFPRIKVAYKKDAKENLHYTTVADRPDIKKATQAAKQASEVRVSLNDLALKGHCEQGQGECHRDHTAHSGSLSYRWSTEPSIARKAVMG